MARKAKKVVYQGDTALEYEQGEEGEGRLVGVRRLFSLDVDNDDLGTLKVTDILAFNSAAERQFCRLLEQMCDQAGAAGVPVRVARAEMAFRLGISTETVKRYIEKWCIAPSAPFEVRDGSIFKKEVDDGMVSS